MIDETHDPALTSWVPGADGHAAFPIQNLPFGIAAPDGERPRVVVAIGDRLLDLAQAAAQLPDAASRAVSAPVLNPLMALPSADRVALRRRLSTLLSDGAHRGAAEPMLIDASGCEMRLPAVIGDYTDFYVGIHHAENIGRQFRPDNPLLPNYKWVPIGYHGRASSVRPSGVPVRRPSGQRKPPAQDVPDFGPSRRLDYELELGVWIGAGNRPGEPIAISAAGDHVAGLCLLNDWSARDFQAWEYQPLGPFLAKSFQTTVSPWIVTAEALAPFRVAPAPRGDGDPEPLPYLWDARDQASGAYAIDLEVHIETAAMREAGLPAHRLSRGGAAEAMYWTVAQIVTHHASNGCDLRSGDLLGTGTLSVPGGYGSLMELSRGGNGPVALPGGETRAFLEDGDRLTLSATARAEGRVPIGFGACTAVVEPALESPAA